MGWGEQEVLLWKRIAGLPKRVEWPRSEAKVRGHVSGPWNSGASVAGTARGRCGTNPGRPRGVRGGHGPYSKHENTHPFLFPNTRTRILSSSPHYCILPLRSLFSCTCRREHLPKSLRAVEGGGALCGPGPWPRLRRVQQREKRQLMFSGWKRKPLSFPNRHTLSPCCSDNKLVISAMNSLTASDLSVTAALSSVSEERG